MYLENSHTDTVAFLCGGVVSSALSLGVVVPHAFINIRTQGRQSCDDDLFVCSAYTGIYHICCTCSADVPGGIPGGTAWFLALLVSWHYAWAE